MKTNTIKELEIIFVNRFKLGTVQRCFDNNFGVSFISLNKIKSAAFLNKFQSWDESKQSQFIIELGGPTNFRNTRKYIDNLIKQNKEKETKENNEKVISVYAQ